LQTPYFCFLSALDTPTGRWASAHAAVSSETESEFNLSAPLQFGLFLPRHFWLIKTHHTGRRPNSVHSAPLSVPPG
jgi:hypothetical protein